MSILIVLMPLMILVTKLGYLLKIVNYINEGKCRNVKTVTTNNRGNINKNHYVFT